MDLRPDMLRSLPGGQMDDSTYAAVEDALDRAEAPMTASDGRWLTLAERVDALAAERELAVKNLQSTWRWRYLAEARLRVVQMALTNDLIRRGEEGRAWDGKFLSEHLEVAADEDADPCFDCAGTGGITDPDTGPMACPCCAGFGLMDGRIVERLQQ